MKMNKYNIVAVGLFLCLAPFSLTSCSEDKGNYDYHEIAELNISGLEDSYTVLKGNGEVLSLRPEVTTTGNPADLQYEWRMQVLAGYSANYEYVVGTEHDIDLSIDDLKIQEKGGYLVFTVIDRPSGTFVTKYITITPTKLTGRGYMLATENEMGNAVVQFISCAADTVVIHDMFGDTYGTFGKPINICCSGRGSNYKSDQTHWVKYWLMTEDDAYQFNNEFEMYAHPTFHDKVLMVDESYERGHNIPIDCYPHNRKVGESIIVLQGKKNIFPCTNGLILSGQTLYTQPVNVVDGKVVKAKPFIFLAFNSQFVWFMFYDEDNERFLGGRSGDGLAGVSSKIGCDVLSDKEGDPFPWNNKDVNRTLVFGHTTTGNDGSKSTSNYGDSYALMRDKGNNDLFVYKFWRQNSATVTKLACWNIGQKAPDVLNAKFYAFSGKRTVLYYTIGSRLYALDYATGFEKVTLIKDFGDEITCMKADDQVEPRPQDPSHFYIATYSTANKGTFIKLKEGTNPNQVELTEVNKWTGLNKIVGWSWKQQI
ncbi:MAG: hypothetical protein IKH64_05655 [Prevotella sp.]|nr:hypothetical protein [Prevotella sp.]